MSELKTAITVASIIVGVTLSVILGDYLGYKFGNWRVAAVMGVIALTAILAFFVYAAIQLVAGN